MMLIPGMEEQLKKVRLFTANVFGRTNVTYNSNCYLEKHRFFLKIHHHFATGCSSQS